MKLSLFLYHLKNRYPPGWRALEKKTLAAHPWCSFCGAKKQLQVHHIFPIHLYPDMALDETNLVVLCEPCHLREGHVSDFQRGFDLAIKDRAFENLTHVRIVQAQEHISP